MTSASGSLIRGRRLSSLRLIVLLAILAGFVMGGFYGGQRVLAMSGFGRTAEHQPWFAPYVDVTATPTFDFQNMGQTTHQDAVLAFIVSDPSNVCTPSWGGVYTLAQAGSTLNLDSRIARLQQQGGSVAVSFGGLKNSELAIGCTNPEKLLSAYQSVVVRYNLNTIDLDLEGPALSDTAAGNRRATAIAKLQSERRAAGKKLAVWVTLPVTPQGLTQAGTNAVAQLLKHGVDLAGVNVMTMDYGSSLLSDQTMLTGSESALIQTERQLKILYQLAGTHLNSPTVWSKIGVTPMIGQNDVQNEVFTLKDALALNKFALSHGVGRMSMWSMNRDITCGSNYVYDSIVSNSCSGVKEPKYGFSNILGKGFNGSIFLSAGLITKADPVSASQLTPDNPATSPYQIWSPTGTYLAGEKVVWHHNVYQAKWWTQGDVPDNPVLQSWQTPWNLIGPVLPGEKPIPQPTVPKGTYPVWSGNATYQAGDRIIFQGTPYQAKWWNQGDSPAAASSDPNGSPWVPLTQSQINAIVSQLQQKQGGIP